MSVRKACNCNEMNAYTTQAIGNKASVEVEGGQAWAKSPASARLCNIPGYLLQSPECMALSGGRPAKLATVVRAALCTQRPQQRARFMHIPTRVQACKLGLKAKEERSERIARVSTNTTSDRGTRIMTHVQAARITQRLQPQGSINHQSIICRKEASITNR
jgi:hypothetical protein